MILAKNKLKKRLRGLLGVILASFLIISALCISAFAATSNIVSDIIPDGTNIPDTDIGGATGMGSMPNGSPAPESPTVTETLPFTIPDTNNGTIPQNNSSSNTGAASSIVEEMTDMDDTDNVGRILGIIIAVIVVLAVIMLIIALVPKRRGDSRNKKNDVDGSDHSHKNK